jgi:serine/threonine protein kinase, bacterial
MIGQLLAGHYRVLQVLGAGGFGQTYITEDLHLPGNPKCVLKHLKPASADRSLLELARKLFEKEAIVMQKLGNHDRIPRLLAYFEEQQEFYLVQEYIPGHPLSAELTEGQRWREDRVVELLQEILEILTFIHAQGVIHRDIKPDNIMRRESDRRLILIDFGAIKQVRNQQMLHGQQTMTVAIGTPGYMPIEQASGAPRASSDIYALGKIGIQALTGVNPWELSEDEQTGELNWEHLTAANPQLVAILQRMTRYHFKDRYLTAEEALQTVNRLAGGTFTTVRSGRTTQPQPASSPSFESQQTVPVYPQTIPAPTPTPTQQPRRRGSFPILAGIASIAAAVGSFALFSSKILERRNFATDLKTDLCRIASPTDLPSTRVRSQPQRDAKIVATVPRGDKVVYLEEQDAFIKIQMADNSTGWVYNNQIRSCNTPAATPKPAPTPAPTPSIAPPKPVPAPSYPPRSRPTPVPTPVPSSPEPSIPIEVPPPISPTISPTLSPTPTPSPSITPTPTPTSTPAAPTPTPTPDGILPTPTPSIPSRARSPIDY